ncbi:TIGR02281 family clan AA aspartic protease [Parvibaculum sp.]|jgi:aspartyl protease family protein|uniref:retropepsin-like aspartic protease family protein n=2 Tax=Parvibaculum sp. TaxID=2024848 RepID=UPI001AFD5B34|nr:TIGR02281 family clan AA aspartic protease [Parvibaculum sp.]MBO6634921.1 TIGR02281 family clan AA aspartic protease [Parvibaculum sp.]MBO6678746.1 TIGR02281 family clan AA aspartic protease [Parvibaculum sp.]
MRQNNWTWAALFLLGIAALVLFLVNRFPGALDGENAQMRLVYSVLLLTLVGGSVALGWRQRAGLALKQAVAWIAIGLVLVIGYSYRDVFSDMGTRVRSEIAPSAPVVSEPGTAYLSRDMTGHFHADATVNGTHVRFLVDTGASDVALTEEDARRAGIDLAALSYTTAYQTANGIIHAARVKLDKVTVGGITLRDVDASVSRGSGLGTSLLGMSFLGRLDSVEVRGERLVLRQ